MSVDEWSEHTGTRYAEALAGEAEYWDNFIAQRLSLGEIPGSVDFRLFFTQLRYKHNWLPPCIGGTEINFRRREINYVLKTAAPRPGMRVLDLGCGAGWLSLELARLGAHVTALDISPTNMALGRYMVETNARNFPFLYQKFAGLSCRLEDFGGVEYVYADLNTVDLPLNEYDAIVVWDSLHHVANLERLLEQVRASLKPGGVFVGLDHAFATPRTWDFNRVVTPWLDDFYAWITKADAEWLYDGANALARRYNWGALAVDYDPTPVPNCGPFMEQMRVEMLEIIRGSLRREAFDKVQAKLGAPYVNPGHEEVSPFEDVSARRLMSVLLEQFSMKQFQTVCPFIEPEQHVPGYRIEAAHYRSEQELVFQHYLAAALIDMGQRAIARGQADGQWFLFHLSPERPARTDSASHLAGMEGGEKQTYITHLEAQLEAKNAALDERLTYIVHLEAEIERKNAALAELEARLGQSNTGPNNAPMS